MKVISHKEFHEIITRILEPHPLKWFGDFTDNGWFLYQLEHFTYEQNRILLKKGVKHELKKNYGNNEL